MLKKILKPVPSGVKVYDPHKAAVTGDTPGNLKVTSGLSASILIKLMAVLSLVITPLIA